MDPRSRPGGVPSDVMPMFCPTAGRAFSDIGLKNAFGVERAHGPGGGAKMGPDGEASALPALDTPRVTAVFRPQQRKPLLIACFHQHPPSGRRHHVETHHSVAAVEHSF